jgi:hypothetical protein
MVIAGMQIPPGLDLLLFSACATTRGVRSVPLPLLKKARPPPPADSCVVELCPRTGRANGSHGTVCKCRY